ncbi:hypothetical protein F5X96DRAFT_689117 [Biscogniauxia mediterranea]|nr:hypothetical protein F5X96DRAFT_689117 [Biscogniauxia mediterranea]
MSSNGPSGGFSLFPNTSSTKPPSRKATPRPRAGSLQSTINQERAPSIEMTPPRNGRRTPDDLSQFIIDGSPPRPAGRAPMASNNPYRREEAGPSVSRPVPASEVPPRTDTALSGASTLVRSPSGRSRSSIAKRPLEDIPSLSSSLPSPPPPEAEAGIRSIFPQYDHTLPFDRQEYFPTQTSPQHIPRTVISRQSHVPPQQSPPMVRSPVRSPLSADSSSTAAQGQGQGQRWPRRPHHQEAPVVPRVSTTEELRDYWKAANGWKASAAEGRGFCLRLTMPERDTPVYALTSAAAQPFYHLRIDPTSASAYVTLSRHDPAKPCKERDPGGPRSPGNSGGGLLGALREAEAASAKSAWHEALTTTLEEPARRQAPGDGLVALLYPRAATRAALSRASDAAAVAAAERECARLVWDGDSGNYFLVHPALATPFCVTVERSPAWSRTEYTVEHIESAQPLGRLTRDGTGEGWMELDTLVAGRVDSYYVLDVAACALLLVAHLDEKNVLVEHFAPPPPPNAHLRSSSSGSGFGFGLGLDGGGGGGNDSGRRSSASRLSSRILGGKPKSKSRRGRIEELELDLESQASSLGGKLSIRSGDKEKLPGTMRTVIKLLSFAFKCVIWALTLAFKALVAVVVGLTKCLTSERL